MTIVADAGRALAIAGVALLSTAATNLEANALHRALTVRNIENVTATDEVERLGRQGLNVIHAIVDFQTAAWAAGEVAPARVQEWLGLEFAEGFDDDGNASGSTLTVSVVDLVNVGAADIQFDEVRDEVQLVESEQGIGDRFAGLAPRIPGLHTIVLIRVGDKVIVMTTSTVEDSDPEPLLTSEALVELARIVAKRFEP